MRHLKYIIAALLCIQMSSCNKFLTLTPHDTKVVNSVEDYRDILASFMRYLKTPTLPSQDVVMGVGLSTLPFPSSEVYILVSRILLQSRHITTTVLIMYILRRARMH